MMDWEYVFKAKLAFGEGAFVITGEEHSGHPKAPETVAYSALQRVRLQSGAVTIRTEAIATRLMGLGADAFAELSRRMGGPK